MRSPTESHQQPWFTGAKLVIWDLDGTLWRGTLDEGDEPELTGLSEWIPRLADLGVVSSVCSVNEPTATGEFLDRLGLTELLVSPRISWSPKPAAILGLMQDLRLRPPDVLMVDDSPRVREQVASVCGVRAIDPATIAHVSAVPDRTSHPTRTRLRQYRVLANRIKAARAEDADPAGIEGFLRGSGIEVALTEVDADADRVAELSARSNQRNLTRSRLTAQDIEQLVADPGVITACVWLSDRFGDSGLVGFVALDSSSGRILHLFFSCRVMNMGLEEWVVQILPSRTATIETQLNERFLGRVDWITLVRHPRSAPVAAGAPQVLWIGGCDLQTVAPYLTPSLAAESRWQLLESTGGVQQYGHSSLLVLDRIRDGETDLFDRIPWLSNWSYDAFDGSASVVLSLWVDYACLTVIHRATGTRLPTYVHLGGDSSDREWNHWWGDDPGRDWFIRDFDRAPALTPAEIAERLARLIEQLYPRSVFLLNAPEFSSDLVYADGAAQSVRNRSVNEAIDDVVRHHSNAHLVDMRQLVRDVEDLASTSDASMLFHYDRRAARRIAIRIESMIRASQTASALVPDEGA